MGYISLVSMLIGGFLLGRLSCRKERQSEEPEKREETSADIYGREYKNPVGLFEAVKRK